MNTETLPESFTCPGWCDGGHSNDFDAELRRITHPRDILSHHAARASAVGKAVVTIEQAVLSSGDLGSMRVAVDVKDDLPPDQADALPAHIVRAANQARSIIELD